MRTVYTAGVFDLLHQGHLNILQASKDIAGFGGQLVVGVVTDAGATAYKRTPIQDEGTRAAVVRSLRMVDAVVMQDGTDPSPVLRTLRPDVMTHGDDWARLKEGQETLDELGIEWVLLPYTPGVSTTATLERIAR